MDERSAAKALADHFKLPFHEVEISAGEMVEGFPALVSRQDDPIADIAGTGYNALAGAARAHGVPVLLQGQGADELFLGYTWVAEAVRQSRRKALVDHTHAPRLRDYLQMTCPKLWPRRAPLNWLLSLGGLRTGWHAYQRDRSCPPNRLVFYDLVPEFAAAHVQIRALYQPQFRESLGERSPFDLFSISRPWPQLETTLTRLICQTYLLENGMAQGDRLAMASSVELRLPLVDYRLVETVMGLRKTYSDVDLKPKFWFREAVRDLLPDWVLNRPKRGFQPPDRTWARALLARYGKRLENGILVQHGILSPQAAHALSKESAGMNLPFKALVLELWCARYGSKR